MVPGSYWKKKSFFLCPFLVANPLRSSSKSKIRSHKENEIFFLAYNNMLILLQQGCNNPIYQGCYNPVTWLLPCQLQG